MIKILLILIIICGFTYVGWGISNYYKKRAKFFEELMLLCDNMRADIDFSNKNLSVIFDNNKQRFVYIKKMISNFCEFLKDKEINLDEKHLFKGISFVKDEEKKLILHFFCELGRHDSENEIKLIEAFKQPVGDVYQKCNEEKNKLGKMSIKISLLLGVMVSILII